jgi:hypothetical protein
LVVSILIRSEVSIESTIVRAICWRCEVSVQSPTWNRYIYIARLETRALANHNII